MKAGNYQNEKSKWNVPRRLVSASGQALQFTQQTTPGGKRFCDAEAKHAEIGFGEDEDWDRYPELRGHDGHEVWQHVLHNRSIGADSGGPRH